MLLIKTSIKPSRIKQAGLGLFTDEPIKKGQTISVFVSGLDIVVSDAALAMLPEVAQTLLKHYGCKQGAFFYLDSDNLRYSNHSFSPNIGDGVNGDVLALEDIPAGTELFCDYSKIDDRWPKYGHKFV